MTETMQQPGRLLIVSGPSGVGKGTLLARVFEKSDRPLVLSVSATTRSPRSGEIDGKHYFFLTKEEFARRRTNGDFLECFEVYAGGDWYGTLASHVEQLLQNGRWVVLEIDVQGAKVVKSARKDAITVFIAPPDPAALRARLLGRGSENEETLHKRLARAEAEMAQAEWYDYRIVNDDLERSAGEFCDILATV